MKDGTFLAGQCSVSTDAAQQEHVVPTVLHSKLGGDRSAAPRHLTASEDFENFLVTFLQSQSCSLKLDPGIDMRNAQRRDLGSFV